ncbi:MAG: hypothetical protein NVS4B3_04630 [Gemmatimonadaceae bacterium]
MSDDRFPSGDIGVELPPEFRPEHEADVVLTMRYVDGELPPLEARRFENRLSTDASLSAVVRGILDVWGERPPSAEAAAAEWARFALRAGIAIQPDLASSRPGVGSMTEEEWTLLTPAEQNEIKGAGAVQSGHHAPKTMRHYLRTNTVKQEARIAPLHAFEPVETLRSAISRLRYAIRARLGDRIRRSSSATRLPIVLASAPDDVWSVLRGAAAERRREERRRLARHIAWIPVIACVAVAAVVLAAPGWYLAHDARTTEWKTGGSSLHDGAAYGASTVAQILLADGSHVMPDYGARLDTLGFAATHRTLRLAGRAIFDIAANPLAPFVVETSNATVTALGTRFRVATDSADDEPRTIVELQQGRAAVQSLGSPSGTSLLLHPGEHAEVIGQRPPVHRVRQR